MALRDGSNAGDVIGPRILASGPALGITGGHCDSNMLAPEYNGRGEGVADLTNEIEILLRLCRHEHRTDSTRGGRDVRSLWFPPS